MTKETLQKLAKESFTWAELQRKLGYNTKGGGVYNKIRSLIKEHDIDITHFKGKGHGTSNTARVELNSSYGNLRSLKRRLVKENILKYVCAECGIYDWNGKQLTLQLDHINGVNNDNRLENLRLLCPNCHSQTETFGGGNTKAYKRIDSSVGRALA